jgi:hypothetical protein
LPHVVRRGLATLAAIASLLLLSAADPAGDVGACTVASTVGSPPDLIEATATAEELGSAAAWRLRFEHLEFPDRSDPPFEIEIQIHDPAAPGDVNRVVRWVARSVDEQVWVHLLPEESETPFNPPAVVGDTVEIRVPGRMIVGEAEDGTSDVSGLRWGVVVRDGQRCDRLGDGASIPFTSVDAGSPSPSGDRGSGSVGTLAAFATAVLVGLAAALGIWRYRRAHLGPGCSR